MTTEQRNRMLAQWLEGELSEADCAKLLAELQVDETFQREASEALLIRRHLDQVQLPADSFAKQIMATVRNTDTEPDSDLTRDVIANIKDHKKRRKHQYILGTATAIISAVAISLLIWNALQKPNQGSTELAVATVLRIDGEAVTGEQSLAVGDVIIAGDNLSMQSGLVEMVFKQTGVHAIATGPLSLTAESMDRIFLHTGDIKLHVPPQGVGFVVQTAEQEITDLGTKFVVSANAKGSQVFVLDGEIEVDGRLMSKGEVASFTQDGQVKHISEATQGLPERKQTPKYTAGSGFNGAIYGLKSPADLPPSNRLADHIGKAFAPLIQSRFRKANDAALTKGRDLRFAGIAGSYNHFAAQSGLTRHHINTGWIAWYSGKVKPPKSGRYRFWGYADNHLMVAINGEPIFDGSRSDSVLRAAKQVKRHNHPAWPCLNAPAGFAAGPWVEVGDNPVQLDILFGELRGTPTSGLLLVEHEGEDYKKTFWGQPRWSLFLTETPSSADRLDLETLRLHMEAKLLGSFSISADSIWHLD